MLTEKRTSADLGQMRFNIRCQHKDLFNIVIDFGRQISVSLQELGQRLRAWEIRQTITFIPSTRSEMAIPWLSAPTP